MLQAFSSAILYTCAAFEHTRKSGLNSGVDAEGTHAEGLVRGEERGAPGKEYGRGLGPALKK